MKKLLSILFIAFVLVLGVWFGGKLYLKQSLISYNGIKKFKNLKSTVKVFFDDKGIPQIFANNENDLFFTLGYLHAGERLFQMELFRRMSNGTLSEVFGDIAYETDLFQRKIGFERKAKKDSKNMSNHLKQVLTSYCNGVNAYIENTKVLPPEFVILGFKPEKWTPENCVTIGLYQTWFSHALMDNDKNYNKAIEKYKGDLLKLLNKFKKWSPATVSDSFIESLKASGSSPFRMSTASNSWVVSPEKSKSGYAIHCSDPHLDISRIPNFWYIAGLHLKDKFNFVGITAPSLPLGLMGHNDNIAYAFTVASVDIIDYYKLKRNPENKNQVLTDKGYSELEKIKEYIKVKGEDKSREITVYKTDKGAVVKEEKDFVIALKWAGFDFLAPDILENGLKLYYATNFEEFRNAVANTGALDANWTYSDKFGNIGYQLGCPIPKRNFDNTFSILDGSNPKFNWQGYYLVEEKPYSYNPQENFIATCNNQIVSDKWAYKIPGFYATYRITRINNLLKSKEKFSKEELSSFQLDTISNQALKWKPIMEKGAVKLQNKQLATKIKNWDCNVTKMSKIAPLFLIWKQQLRKNIFSDDFNNINVGKAVLETTVEENVEQFIDDKTTKEVENLEDISAKSLKEALKIVKNKSLSEISSHTLKHPLSKVKILDKWLNLNRGPFFKKGDKSSLNANFLTFDSKTNTFKTVVGASMRFTLDWENPDTFSIYTNLGQSGNPFSQNYDSFLKIWQNGKSHSVPINKTTIEKTYHNKLILEKE